MNVLEQLKTSLADHYEIEREIGAGGMATVYLARDLRHDRPVAVKVLNPDLGAVLGVERFLAEIKVTANLQHPNLLPLFDSGEAGGLLFYVMPYVDGESLRAKLHREKQLPIDEAVRITTAIASALATAHEHGVIHRDLKPENILMQSGQPVIADFGIALAVSKAGGNRVTQTGISLGTPQYMSPEQATGDRVIDGRSDIYSLAAMAYEMLTGEAPHQGNTAQAIIARVLTEKPRSIRLSRESVPEHVAAAIEHGLEKLAADRFSTAREFGEAIQGRGASLTQTSARTAAEASAKRARFRDPVTLGLGLVALGAIATAVMLAKKVPPADAAPPFQFVLAQPDSIRPVDWIPWPAAISPSGDMVVYAVGSRGAGSNLYSLRTNQLEPHAIPGTSDATQPMFSPDGEWLAFEVGDKERKVKLDGSAPVTIATGASQNGIAWTETDEIVVGATGKNRGLSRVSAAGGDLVEFTHPDQTHGSRDHLWPVVAPDNKTAVFAVWTGSLITSELASAALDDSAVVPLGIKGIRPLAILDGVLVYLQADGAVMAAPFDAKKKRAGKAFPVHDPVPVSASNNGNSGIFISRGGSMVTARGSSFSKLALSDLRGNRRELPVDGHSYFTPRISPDGRHIAVGITDNSGNDVWIYDIATTTLTRLTSNATVTGFEWTPDGKYIVFSANGEQRRNAAWMQLAAGGAAATKLVENPELTPRVARSPDGKWLLQMVLHENSWDLERVPVDSPKARSNYVATPANEAGQSFSPNGRWVVMASSESGRPEVYVRSFPDPSVRVQISAGGGLSAQWAPDGSAIYYSSGTHLLRAKVAHDNAFHVLSRDTVMRTFEVNATLLYDRAFDVARDGQSVLLLNANRDNFQLVVAPNWRTELRRRLAAAKQR